MNTYRFVNAFFLKPITYDFRSHQDDSDPVVQIGKVLNAHMDSLQWIDQTSAQLHRKVEEVAREVFV